MSRCDTAEETSAAYQFQDAVGFKGGASDGVSELRQDDNISRYYDAPGSAACLATPLTSIIRDPFDVGFDAPHLTQLVMCFGEVRIATQHLYLLSPIGGNWSSLINFVAITKIMLQFLPNPW